MMLRDVRGMVNKIGHYNNSVSGLWDGSPQLGRLADAYCDYGYHYEPPPVDNCVPDGFGSGGGYCDNPANAAECTAIDCNATPALCGNFDPTLDTPTVITDQGNSQIWQQIINSVGRIATQVVAATSTQYQTRYGTYSYGTGPYSGLNPTLAQQYLNSRGTFGGMSTTTMLLIGGALVVMLMLSKR